MGLWETLIAADNFRITKNSPNLQIKENIYIFVLLQDSDENKRKKKTKDFWKQKNIFHCYVKRIFFHQDNTVGGVFWDCSYSWDFSNINNDVYILEKTEVIWGRICFEEICPEFCRRCWIKQTCLWTPFYFQWCSCSATIPSKDVSDSEWVLLKYAQWLSFVKVML